MYLLFMLSTTLGTTINKIKTVLNSSWPPPNAHSNTKDFPFYSKANMFKIYRRGYILEIWEEGEEGESGVELG